MLHSFDDQLSTAQRALIATLDSPPAIQAFLDRTPYSPENANRCPLSVLRDGLAHCLDGALLAAAALRRLGYPPLVIDLLPDPGADDDHVLAIFQQHGHWGAVAKSNYVGLRYREPIYRTLRELALSYFEDYYNLYGEKTLRAYTRPLHLRTLDAVGWMVRDAGADAVEQRLYTLKRVPLLSQAMVASLQPVETLAYQAGMLGTNLAGVYRPRTPAPPGAAPIPD